MSSPVQRVLVTGGAGFVGASLVRQLVAQGREVAVLLRPGSDARRLQPLLQALTVIRVDLTHTDDLRPPLAGFRPDAVMHLAWGGVKGADRNSAVQLGNVSATLRLYQQAREVGCGRFVGLGSQAEYGLLAGRIDETAATLPTTVYGACKLACAQVLERLSAADGQAFAWLRLFSSYGEDDDPSWMLPYLTNELLAGRRPKLTQGGQVWDYIHVDDVAAGLIAALDAQAQGIFNLGSGQARPLRETIMLLRDQIDPALPLGFGDVDYRPDQVMHLEADVTALSNASGWRPRVALEEGLSRLVQWHRLQSSAR